MQQGQQRKERTIRKEYKVVVRGLKEVDINCSLAKLCFTKLNQWCHPTISSSVAPFSSCPQSFPAPGSFQVSPFFTSGGQSIGASASASVLHKWSSLILYAFSVSENDFLDLKNKIRVELLPFLFSFSQPCKNNR